MADMGAAEAMLEIENLRTQFFSIDGTVRAVDGVSLSVARGEILGVVGESGCGKSVTALSVLRLVPNPPGRIVGGAIRFQGRNLLDLSEPEMRKIRGNDISMIFQEPMTSLNPVLTVGNQLSESLVLHQGLSRRDAWDQSVEMLEMVRIPEPARRVRNYPHELSGGMRQRVMIAMALACNPQILLADEPTTALDVTIQAQILELMRELQSKLDTAIVLITHDMGIIAENADRVVVMYAGKKVEEASVEALFGSPLHPYTRGLLASIPRPDIALVTGSGRTRLNAIEGIVPSLYQLPRGCVFAPRCPRADGQCRDTYPPLEEKSAGHWAACWHSDRLIEASSGSALPPAAKSARAGPGQQQPARQDSVPLLEVSGLKKYFPIRKGLFGRLSGRVHAVDEMSFVIRAGETLGLVGESGCGKSTAGRAVLKLIEPTAGRIRLRGRDITHLDRNEMRVLRRQLQIIFQDPYSSLNPRMTAGELVGEPLTVHKIAAGREKEDRVAALFARVGLRAEQMSDYPHQFSGGQRQRIAIARALSLSPSLIVGDEPVSALDVSIQAQVINLLMDLQDEYGLSYLFIAHDLTVVEHISHRIAVMYLGRIVELSDKQALFATPLHPYSEALLSAVLIPDPKATRGKRIILSGDVPSPIEPPSGCHFHTRCPYVMARCKTESPRLQRVVPGHWVSCHLHEAGS